MYCDYNVVNGNSQCIHNILNPNESVFAPPQATPQ